MTMHSRTLYVTDLDGTLLDSSVQVPREAAAMINRAIGAGALFTVATARTPGTLCRLLKDVRLDLPAIVMTGATMWHRDTDTYSDTCFIPADTASGIREIYKRHRLPSFIYTLSGDMIYVYHQGHLSEMERSFIEARAHNPYKTICVPPDGDSVLPDAIDNAVLFFAMQPSHIGQPAFADLKALSGINPMYYIDANHPEIAMIEAFSEKASKAEAILRLARESGAERIVVFGDNRNDLSMFDIADVAVAVDNAIPEVKQRADIIIGSHDTSAVARFILDDFLSRTGR